MELKSSCVSSGNFFIINMGGDSTVFIAYLFVPRTWTIASIRFPYCIWYIMFDRCVIVSDFIVITSS